MSLSPNDILTAQQAADYTHVDTQSVYLAIRKGRLKAEKEGIEWRIKRGDLDEYRLSKFDPDLRNIDGEPVYDPEKGTFSVQQVCLAVSKYLNVPYPKTRLYHKIRKGKVKAERKKNLYVIQRQDAEALLQEETNCRQLTFL